MADDERKSSSEWEDSEIEKVAMEEEIAEYYHEEQKKSKEKADEKPAVQPKKKSKPKSGLLKFDFDIDDGLTEEIYEFPIQQHSNLLFCSACILVAAIFLCTAYSVGTNRSASQSRIQAVLEQLRTNDSNYLDATEKNQQLDRELADLMQQQLEIQELTNTLGDYDGTKQSLEKKLQDAKDNFQQKNDTLYSLNQEIQTLKQQTLSMTLTPGVYYVGKNIPAGSYDVSGEGSLIGATSVGETKINIQLSRDTKTQLELKEGYTVKLNHTTEFILKSTQ